MNSPWAMLMMPIMPKMMASPAAARIRKAKTSANWNAIEKASANMGHGIDGQPQRRSGPTGPARPRARRHDRGRGQHYFFGRLLGEYCVFGSLFVRSQPTSPSQ